MKQFDTVKKTMFTFAAVVMMTIVVLVAQGTTTEVYASGSSTVIYYDNSNWSSANIHYKVGNGEWTSVPGERMERSVLEGYKFKYTIELDEAENVTFCFNDGNGNWDSRYGTNYTAGAGIYGVKNGNVTEITDELYIREDSFSASKHYVYLGLDVENFDEEYSYTYTLTQLKANCGLEIFKPQVGSRDGFYTDYLPMTFTLYRSGEFKLDITVTDKAGKTAFYTKTFTVDPLAITAITPDVNKGVVGQEVEFYADCENVYSYYLPMSTYWTVEKDGKILILDQFSECSRYFKWTPDEKGTYTISVYAKDSSSDEAVCSTTFEVKETQDNIVKVYYNNSAWSTAKIHYGINGNWTQNNGIEMKTSDDPKYTWMYTINLGEAENAQVCFNNGAGQWDSRNAQNYAVGTGTYAVIYGNVYHIAD